MNVFLKSGVEYSENKMSESEMQVKLCLGVGGRLEEVRRLACPFDIEMETLNCRIQARIAGYHPLWCKANEI